MLLQTTLIPNSSAQGQRLLLFDIPVQHQLFVSCHSCLQRCCTLSGAVQRTVRFRMEKADAMTFCSQFDPQTSVWFDHSTEDSSRTVSYLIRRLRSALRGVASRRSSSPLQLYVQSSFLIQQLRNINIDTLRSRYAPVFQSSTISNSIDQLYEVLFRRTPFNTRPRQFVRLHVREQCRTPLTRHVVATQPFSRVQQCRTPSTNCTNFRQQCRTPSTLQWCFQSTMSNSIDSCSTSVLCMPSPAMSNSIDKSYCRHNGASVQQCRTPSTIQADKSCVQS